MPATLVVDKAMPETFRLSQVYPAYTHVHMGHVPIPGPGRYAVGAAIRAMTRKLTGGPDSYFAIQAALFLGLPPGGDMIPGSEVLVCGSKQGEWELPPVASPPWWFDYTDESPTTLDIRFSVLVVEAAPGQNPIYVPDPAGSGANISPNWCGVATDEHGRCWLRLTRLGDVPAPAPAP